MLQTWSPQMVLETSLSEFKPEQVSSFVAKLSLGKYDGTNFAEKQFSRKFKHTTLETDHGNGRKTRSFTRWGQCTASGFLDTSFY
jgi:hypothetical protein